MVIGDYEMSKMVYKHLSTICKYHGLMLDYIKLTFKSPFLEYLK